MKNNTNHSIKVESLQQQILEYLGTLIHNEVKDPRVSRLTSVVRVEVAHDLKYARVHITTLGTDEERKSALEGLNSAKGYLRTRLSKIMKTRIAPELTFINDTSIEYAAHIQKTLESLNIKSDDEENEIL